MIPPVVKILGLLISFPVIHLVVVYIYTRDD